MKTEIEGFEIETNVNGFEMENADKLSRVVFGDMGRGGVLTGGLTLDVAEKDPELVLAHYDKLAGLIKKDGIKIKTGSFWNFKLKQPRKDAKGKYAPDVMYIFNIGGDNVEVDDPKNLASAIGMIEKVRTEKEEKVKAKKAKSKLFKEEIK